MVYCVWYILKLLSTGFLRKFDIAWFAAFDTKCFAHLTLKKFLEEKQIQMHTQALILVSATHGFVVTTDETSGLDSRLCYGTDFAANCRTETVLKMVLLHLLRLAGCTSRVNKCWRKEKKVLSPEV